MRGQTGRQRRLLVCALVAFAVVMALLTAWLVGRVLAGGAEPAPSDPPAASATTAPSPGATASPPAAVVPPQQPSSSPSPSSGTSRESDDGVRTALEAAVGLQVAEHDWTLEYDREVFAYRAVDLDRNGCDVRNDVLRRDLDGIAIRPGTQGCVVESGRLHDPYSGSLIEFLRGDNSVGVVEIDHVVSLHNAWVTGAQDWDVVTLQTFGNDPLNLLAVSGPMNRGKGSADAAEWLPPSAEYQCEFVARQVAVKEEYGLAVTAGELDAMVTVLSGCPAEPLPTAASTATP
ncbi:MAG TPA: HNH endonuclease family protein [Actinomycetaceae bacterium]|nr:HNH endonuclease family protein [Actinomycetaceae bacterium]